MNQNNSNYFIQTLAIMVISIIAFVFLKPFLPKKLFPEVKNASKNIVVDSLMLEALASEDFEDSESTKAIAIKVKDTSIYQFSETDYVGYGNLVSLYEKLYKLETTGEGKVKVAYYGDSMNDGDMIVQDVRANFQDQFGGEGIGFVNIASESSASRSSVKHEHSKNWSSKSYVNTKHTYAPFGVSGNVFFANDTNNIAWVKYESSKYRHLTNLPNPTLYYGKSKKQNGKVAIIQDKDTIYKKLSPSKLVNKLELPNSAKKIKINFIEVDSIPFYGLSFEEKSGVYVDNFSNRGNSGLPIINLKTEVLNQFNSSMNYDLVVLQYGTNVLNYGSLNFSWYEKKMKNVIAHIREAMPNAAIVVVSIADKSTKYDNEMRTDSAVVPLIKAQLKYAKESQVGFVNLFDLMGGKESMVKWTEEEPAKANKDYTHLNFRGAKIASDLIYKKIIAGYEQFKVQKQKQAAAKPAKSVIKKTDSISKKEVDKNITNDTLHAN